MICPKCGVGEHVKKNKSLRYTVCPVCHAIYLDFSPLPYQKEFLKDKHNRYGLFGGYGSGKTTASCARVAIHAMTIPNGKTLVTAQTVAQAKNTAVPTLLSFIPKELIERKTTEPFYIKLHNGHEILLFASDDEEKLRSLDLTCYYMVEASGIKHDIVTQLETRMRNTAGFEFEYDKRGNLILDDTGHAKIDKDHTLGIIESNPSMGWIRDKILFTADVIHGRDAHKYNVPEEEKNHSLAVYVPTSYDNIYLTKAWFDRQTQGKPMWWIKRYIEGSFEYNEGAVYPHASDHIIEPISIPPTWERIFGVDFGLRDPTVMLAGAIDPKTGITYIYEEHYESGKHVSYHAQKMNTMVNAAKFNMYRPIQADPKGGAAEISTARSLFSHYLEYGLYMQPANNNILSGISKVYNYFSMGKLKIFNTCVNTVKELANYIYPEVGLDNKKNLGEKPIDKDNHAMDALRYMVQALPDDPEMLKHTAIKRDYRFDPNNLTDTREKDVVYIKQQKEWWQ